MRLTVIIFVLLSVISTSIYPQSTVSQNVSNFELYAPQLKINKKIWVYLPADYQNSRKRYPVIYMHDGQNLFDRETSYAGEWKIDEYFDSNNTCQAIIIGIEHGGEKRIDELTPFGNDKYGGGMGDKYLDFIVNTLKPYVDSNYKTKQNKKHTTIFGSSLGGLISFYAIFKHPKVFGNAGVFSPSFWFSEEIFNYIKDYNIELKGKVYFMVGDQEGENMVEDMKRMISLLKRLQPKLKIHQHIVINAEHNEKTWSEAFPQAIQWLNKKNKN
ncbi:alpha/beta hydrolase [Aegicerativicinus sediminis]|uniref:alpha/beta hydrolase n=1 Tax=Aegicerativicinus sediminis TaxID=2893202 RepID=UPI001E3F2830|nr:alpha/beta hydrolase-fold protein [Aegicerativicinus sediminis]